MMNWVLFEVDEDEHFDKSEDLFLPFGDRNLGIEGIQHDNDELLEINESPVKIESFFDFAEIIGRQFLHQVIFELSVDF